MNTNYKITACMTCPFCVQDINMNDYDNDDFFSSIYTCNILEEDWLIARIRPEDEGKPYPKSLVDRVLPNCPLKKGTITVKLI